MVASSNYFQNEITNDLNESIDSFQELRKLRIRNIGRLIIGNLNINSIRNKFDSLSEMVKENVDSCYHGNQN